MNTLEYIVKKYGLDISSESPIKILGIDRRTIPTWFKDLGFRLGAEIGVASGRYLRSLCFENPGMLFFGVDPLIPYDGYDLTDKNLFTKFLEKFKKSMVGFSNYEIIRKLSVDAANHFKDRSLDFVYIDANHQDPYVTQDIVIWSEKVRSGGIVAGHDYIPYALQTPKTKYDVIEAVNRYVSEKGIKTWFILPDDRCVSLFFVKP
jgi:hypothetical protein